jgi:hypothetical protein
MPPGIDDYYAILNVGRAADFEEIRRAFRDEARRWHPDKNSAPGAAERFMKVYESYEILSNPWKRKVYDGRLTVADRQASPEYEAWRAEARRHAQQYSRTNYDLFMRQVIPDLRAILFGAPPPDLHRIIVIFLKAFTGVTALLLFLAIPWGLKRALSFLPSLVVTTLKLDPALLPWVDMTLLIVAAVSCAIVLVVILLGGRAMGWSWADGAVNALGFLFISEERLIPLVHGAIGLLISLLIWAWGIYLVSANLEVGD